MEPLSRQVRYFVARGDRQGALVPLIPADELPFALKGVPDTLHSTQTFGLRYAGKAPRLAGPNFEVENGQAPDFEVPRICVPSQRSNDDDDDFSNMPTDDASLSSAPCLLEDRPSSTQQTSSSGSREPLMLRAVQLKPLCRHWLQHGTCKYDHACKFRHEIPPEAVLRRYGFLPPYWWEMGVDEIRSMSRTSHGDRRLGNDAAADSAAKAMKQKDVSPLSSSTSAPPAGSDDAAGWTNDPPSSSNVCTPFTWEARPAEESSRDVHHTPSRSALPEEFGTLLMKL